MRLRDDAGLQVVFESAADAAMHTRHASGDLYKLVFFAMPVCVRAGMRLPMCCGNPPMDEFDQRSWWTPTLDDAAWVLPADLRAADPLNGRDCGWFNQMRPFVRHFSRPGEQVFDRSVASAAPCRQRRWKAATRMAWRSIRHARSWHARACSSMRR